MSTCVHASRADHHRAGWQCEHVAGTGYLVCGCIIMRILLGLYLTYTSQSYYLGVSLLYAVMMLVSIVRLCLVRFR